MTSNRVLKFARSDSDEISDHVLIQVTSRGSRPLDVDLVATEGDGRFVGSLSQKGFSSLKVKNCPASDSEWEAILNALLDQDQLGDIQATAAVQSQSSMSITIRKQVQGITQRLGSITLKYDMSQPIELFDWCSTAADAAAQCKEVSASAETKVQKLESIVNDLKAQLDELIQAKEQDETTLLHRFRDLLNEKKVKIREQQKLLATASFETSRPASSQSHQEQTEQPARKAGKSRPTKRKAAAANAQEDTNADDDQKMEVDDAKSEPEDTDGGHTTEATASTASDDEDEEAAPPQTRANAAPQKKATGQPPPPRSLPFARGKPANLTATPAAAGVGSDTDSDDEL